MEDVDESGVVAGEGFVVEDSFEFADEGAFVVKVFTPYDFDGAVGSGEGAGEPDFSIGSAADLPDDGVVRDFGECLRSGEALRGGRG